MQTRTALLQDINALSYAWTVEAFKSLSVLFFAKWTVHNSAKVVAVVTYFKDAWCDNNTGGVNRWYRGCCPNNVMNDGGLESKNRRIKVEVTKHQLMPPIDFLMGMAEWMRSQSWERDPNNPNRITFQEDHTLITKDYTDAYAWINNNRKQIRYVDRKYVGTSAGTKGDLTDDRARTIIEKFDTCSWSTFDEYTTMMHNVCVLSEDDTRQEGYNCTCAVNAKTFTCQHSLGVANMNNRLLPPNRAQVTLLGQKRKRGRRARVGAAWVYQELDIASPPAHPQQNPEELLEINDNIFPENLDMNNN